MKRPLGHGSFASVYEGYDKQTNERRAIKVVDLKKLQAKSDYAESEMKIMMRLQARKHPSLVGMYKAFRVNEESVALVLEYCDKGDLSSYVDAQPNKRLPESMAKKLMQDLALGLSFLRSKNIIHRDLKPQNLLMKSHPRGLVLKIADFGFAKELSDFNEVIPSLVGSPMYLAPELWKKEGYTTQSDLWSVGVILFEIIFGHYLYFAKSVPQLVHLVKTKDVESAFPADLVNTISPECLDLIRGLLKKDPEERFTWDKYLSHPWLDLETRFFFFFFICFLLHIFDLSTEFCCFHSPFPNLPSPPLPSRKLVDSFCDLEADDDLINHDASRSLETKPQQILEDDFDSPESEEPAMPQSRYAPKPMESPELSALDPSLSLAADFDPFAGKGGGEETGADPLETAKALQQLARHLEKGEPERSLSLYMELLAVMKDLKPKLTSDPQRAKAQVIFQNAIKMADLLTKGLPSNAKIPTSSRVIQGLAVELNQKAEIDELFEAFAMAVEEYSLAALLLRYLESKEGLEEQEGFSLKSRVEKYERSAWQALKKKEKAEERK